MIKQRIQDKINEQIQAEFKSAYTYLGFSGWFESKSLPGFAHWMKKQWEEEIEHGMKFHRHQLSRDGKAELRDLSAPNITAETPLQVFEQALEQERNITKRIHKLYDLAEKEGDYPLKSLLLWFIDEQVEEEASVSQIADELRMVGEDRTGLLLLDKELSERTD